MDTPRFSHDIQAMLDDRDLNRLVAVLRSPADPDRRDQAAWALGQLQDPDATESLARSANEDPDAGVRASARRALEELLGNQANLVIASYRSGPPDPEPWLVESADEEDSSGGMESDIDTEGLIRVASHESNPAIRLQAIRALGHSSDTRATDMLAFLALHGDTTALRQAARQALVDRHGDQAEDILRAAASSQDEEDEDVFDEDLEGELDEDLSDEEWEDELSAEDEDNEDLPADRTPQYPVVSSSHSSGVVEEVGFSWQAILLVGLVIVVVAILVWLLFFRA